MASEYKHAKNRIRKLMKWTIKHPEHIMDAQKKLEYWTQKLVKLQQEAK